MSKSKKLVSIVLAAIMVFSACPLVLTGNLAANAAGEYGGTSSVQKDSNGSDVLGSGSILAPSGILIDTSETDEVVRVASAQYSTTLPDYANNGTAYIVAATDSGVPEYSVNNSYASVLQLGYGGETPHWPRIVLRVKMPDGSAPTISSSTEVQVIGSNATFTLTDESTVPDSEGFYKLTWTMNHSSSSMPYVTYGSGDYSNGHLSKKDPLTYVITFKIGRRTYTQYAYAVVKEIVIPNGTFMHMQNNDTNIRCSYISQILCHNMESGWSSEKVNSQKGRSYIQYEALNSGATDDGFLSGGAIKGMGEEGAVTSQNAFNYQADLNATNAKVINFATETSGYSTDIGDNKSGSINQWGYKSNAYDVNRTVTTIYRDLGDPNESDLSKLNLRMTFKVGETSNFGAMAINRAVIRAGTLNVSDLTSQFTPDVSKDVFKVEEKNANGRILCADNNYPGASTTYSNGITATGNTECAYLSNGQKDFAGVYNVATFSGNPGYFANGMTNSSESDYSYNYRSNVKGSNKNQYVYDAGNYLTNSDVFGTKILTLNFSGAPTANDYTLVYEVISSTTTDFHMEWKPLSYLNAIFQTRYYGIGKTYKQKAQTANTFHVVTYNTADLRALVKYIEQGGAKPSNTQSDYDVYTKNKLADLPTNKGTNPQEDMYIEGWATYIEAYKTAKKCLSNYTIIQNDINSAYGNLYTAYSALVPATVTIVAKYTATEADGTTTVLGTDTFTTQPGTQTALAMGSEFYVTAPSSIGHYKAAVANQSYKGYIGASSGTIGYVLEANPGTVVTTRTSNFVKSGGAATATITFNFQYVPKDYFIYITTNNDYAGEGESAVPGQYEASAKAGEKLFKDVTSSTSFLQTMLGKIGGKEHFSFAGIYSDASFNTPVVSVNNGSPVSNSTWAVPADENGTFLFLKWKPDNVTFKVVGVGASSEILKTETITMSDNLTGTITNPQLASMIGDNELLGYYKDADHTIPVDFGTDGVTISYENTSALTIDSNNTVTVYAYYVNTNGAITFDANGGTLADTTTKNGYVVKNNEMAIKKGQTNVDYPIPTRLGYIFKGWVLTDGTPVPGWTTGSASTGYTPVENGVVTNLTKGFVAKAMWEAKQYTVVMKITPMDNGTSRFSDKEKAVFTTAGGSQITCYAYATVTVDAPVTDAVLKPYGADPVQYAAKFSRWQINGKKFADTTWPATDSEYITLTAMWDYSNVSAIAYTSLDGYETISGTPVKVDTTKTTEDKAVSGDIVDFRFTMSGSFFASSTSFIFAYDSDFYELPYTDAQYASGNVKAVTINTENPYIAGIGGNDVEHYESIDSDSASGLKAQEFNYYTDDGTGRYVLTTSTVGAVVSAANAESEVSGIAPMTNYKLVKVSFDPHLASMSNYKTQSMNTTDYMFTLKLRIKEGATGKGAVRFCSELMRTYDTLLGDVYVAASSTSETINKASTLYVYGTNPQASLTLANNDTYTVVDVGTETQQREQYTITLALPYGTAVGQADSPFEPYFQYTYMKGNFGYTRYEDGVLVYYDEAAGEWKPVTETKTINDKWLNVNGTNYSAITFTGDEGAEIYTTYTNGTDKDFYQDSVAEHNISAKFTGIPEAKRTTSIGSGEDAYTFAGWYRLNTTTGAIDMTDQWTPGYYASSAQAGAVYAAVWTVTQRELNWFYDKEMTDKINFSEVLFDIDTVAPKVSNKTDSWVTDAALCVKRFDRLDLNFIEWRDVDTDEVVDFTTYKVTKNANFYAITSVDISVNLFHKSVNRSDENLTSTDVTDYTFSLGTARQQALLELTDGVKRDTGFTNAIGVANAVIHIVDVLPATLPDNDKLDFYITYDAFNNFIEGFTSDYGTYAGVQFSTITTTPGKYQEYFKCFDIDKTQETTLEVVTTKNSTNVINVQYVGKEANAKFTVALASQKYVSMKDSNANILAKDGTDTTGFTYTYTVQGARFGDTYSTTKVGAERDLIYNVIGKPTWGSAAEFGYFGSTHELTVSVSKKNLVDITVHYYDENGTTQKDSQTIKNNATDSYKDVTQTKNGYNHIGWVPAELVNDKYTAISDASMIATTDSFDVSKVKDYIVITKGTTNTFDLYLVPVFEIQKFDVVFNANGGTFTDKTITAGTYSSSDTLYTFNGEYGASFEFPKNPTRDDYLFGYWGTKDAQGNIVMYNGNTIPENGLVLYAKWNKDSRTVTYNAGAGSFTETTQGYSQDGKTYTFTGEIGSNVVKPKDPILLGKTFAGWDKIDTGIVPSENIEYTAQWSDAEVTVEFVTTGEAVTGSPFTYTYNQTITVPGESAKTGYKFNGWFTAEEGGVKLTEGNSPESLGLTPGEDGTYKLTYYAQYTINQYKVTFDVNSTAINSKVPTFTGADDEKFTASGNNKVFKADYNSAVIIPGLELDGYTFQGWYIGDTKYEGNKLITASDITVTAKWKHNEITVNIVDGDTTVSTYTKYYEDVIDLPERTKDGYTFGGWKYNDTVLMNGEEFATAFTVPALADGTIIKVETKWNIDSHSVKFIVDSNDLINTSVTWDYDKGSPDYTVDEGNVIFTEEYNKTVVIPTVSAPGYTFDGWYLGDARYDLSTKSIGTSDIEVKAHWTRISYKAQFMGTGSSAIQVITPMYYGDTVDSSKLPAEADTAKAGYNFLGWTTADHGSDEYYIYSETVSFYYVTETAPEGNYEARALEMSTWTMPALDTEVSDTFTFYPVYEKIEVTIQPDPSAPSVESPFIDEIKETKYKYSTEGRDYTRPVSGINGYIYNVDDRLTSEEITSSIKVSGNGHIVITESKSNHGIKMYGTGTRVDVYDDDINEIVEVYYLIVFGDVEGDGACDSTDISIMKKQVANSSYNWGLTEGSKTYQNLTAGLTPEAAQKAVAVRAACYLRAATVGQQLLGDNITTANVQYVNDYVMGRKPEYELVKVEEVTEGRGCYYNVVAR